VNSYVIQVSEIVDRVAKLPNTELNLKLSIIGGFMKKVILCLLAISILGVASVSANNIALLHGVNYPPAGEKWFWEAFSFGVVLSGLIGGRRLML
jgi:hypothetical protein